MRKKYFDLHVFFGIKNGSSYFFETNLPDDYTDNDVVSDAINKKIIEPDDMEYVDYVEKVTKKEYERATGRVTPNSIKFMKSLKRKK